MIALSTALSAGGTALSAGFSTALAPAFTTAVSPESLMDQPVAMMLLLAGLSLLPFAAMATSAFVKIAVVLSIARTAIGVQQLPPTTVITALALVLSLHVMAPVGEAALEAWEAADQAPLTERLSTAADPVRAFLQTHARPEDVATFVDLAAAARGPEAEAPAPDTLQVLVPAFLIGELRDAFRIGFLIFLPFLVVDLVVGTVLLALGMHMLSPTTVSLPFKLLLFVAADGWRLIAEALVRGYLVP